MDRFRLCLLLALLLLFCAPNPVFSARRSTSTMTRMASLSSSPSSPSTSNQQLVHDLHPFKGGAVSPFAGQAGPDLSSEKRRIPTGSNPLHN
ncbi:hypothetical protein ACJRO7_006596 [Eucalyptus globulus]|uniref:Uncharacterized protein n=1 Tax=Eucalyptus globulus TaxID=34317 RepID=A0ABD3IJ61_EUCGL